MTINFLKKPRIVEVHQVSGQDMVSFLNGASPAGMEHTLLPAVQPEYHYQNVLTAPSHVYSVPPPGYPSWPFEFYSGVSATAKSSMTENEKTEAVNPNEIYSYGYAAPPSQVYVLPRYQPFTFMSKPALTPVIMPQLTPLGMGLLGLKRSWDQAFPMDPPMHAPKRWYSGIPNQSYYPDNSGL